MVQFKGKEKETSSFEDGVDDDYMDYKGYNKSFGKGYSEENYSLRDLSYDSPYGTQTTIEKYSKYDDEVKPEDIKKSKQLVEDEVSDAVKDIDDALESVDFLSKKEKKAMKRVLMKRLATIKKTFIDELDMSANGFKTWIDDIETEVDDKIEEFKDAIASILDVDSVTSAVWPNKKCVYKSTWQKNYASDISITESDQRLKIKLDKKSLEEFLCQSDGDLENIAMITADNRDFKDVENVIFKISHVEDGVKKRQHAYTEADGKAIANMLDKGGLTKCGWIHTHPFSKTSTFFSGTDIDNTKEMCVFPDDYALAIVVGCKYSNPTSYLEKGIKVIRECDVEWSLGSMLYRKQSKDQKGPMKLNVDAKDMMLIKHPIDITIVDDAGKPTEYENVSQDNSLMDDVKSTLSPAVQLAIDSNPEDYGYGCSRGSWECG